MILGYLKIAKVDDDAFLLFKSVYYGLYYISKTASEKKDSIQKKKDTNQITKIIETEKTEMGSLKTIKDSVKLVIAAEKPKIKTSKNVKIFIKKELKTKLNFKADSAQLNIFILFLN